MKIKHQTVQNLTAGQMKELISAVAEGIPSNLSQETAQYWIGKKKKLSAEIRKILVGQDKNQYADLIQDWQNFYHSLSIDCDLSDIRIPDDPGGFDRVIIMVQGITPQAVFNLCQKEFKCWKWTDKNLDEVITSDRTTKDNAYAIRIRNSVEADKELKNLSANQLKEQNIPGITLEERLIYEIKFFKETGKHLDIQNITLCAGSRFDAGDVPYVYWSPNDGKLSVYWCNPGNRYDYLCARQAVS